MVLAIIAFVYYQHFNIICQAIYNYRVDIIGIPAYWRGTYFGGCDQILNKLREGGIFISQGSTISEASRKIEVTEQTCYRWRKEYDGMRLEQAKRMKDLEEENARLKKLVVGISLDNAILKEVEGLLSPSKRLKVILCV